MLGSLPFFGRGLGKRKFKQLCQRIHDYPDWTISSISEVEGFDITTAEKILAGMDQFEKFCELTEGSIIYKGQVVHTGPLDGHKVCMTGFRDSKMSEWIEELGGEVSSGVSGKTTTLVCVDSTANTGKVKKANDINDKKKGNIEIVNVDEYKSRLTKLMNEQ